MQENYEKLPLGVTFDDILEPIAETEAVQDIYNNGEIVDETTQMVTIQFEIENLPEKPKEKPKRFICEHCPRKFTRNLHLTKHFNNVHLKMKVRVRLRCEFKVQHIKRNYH